MHETIDTFPADCLVGTARVYDFSDRDWKPGEVLTRDDILDYERKHGAPVGKGEIAFVNFGWLKRYWHCDRARISTSRTSPAWMTAWPRSSATGASRRSARTRWPVRRRSSDGVMGDAPGHSRHWLPHRILILECVARLELLPRSCFVFMAPLPIENGSGSPLRPLAFF